MDNTLEFVKSLETKIWELALNNDKKGYLKLVDKEAVMVCGGYRCLGKEYAEYIEEGIASSYEFINFEVVYESEEAIQVHYVVQVECEGDYSEECSGKFHVTSTWKRQGDGYKLVFNMDSRIMEP